MSGKVVLYHVTLGSKLQGIIEDEGLKPNSEKQEFVLRQWAALVQNVEGLEFDADEDTPAILRITIPFEDFKNFEMYKYVSDEGEESQYDSYFFVDPIPISYLEVATYDNPDYVGAGQPWKFIALADYDSEDGDETLLDLPGETDEFDMSAEFLESVKEYFEKTQD